MSQFVHGNASYQHFFLLHYWKSSFRRCAFPREAVHFFLETLKTQINPKKIRILQKESPHGVEGLQSVGRYDPHLFESPPIISNAVNEITRSTFRSMSSDYLIKYLSSFGRPQISKGDRLFLLLYDCPACEATCIKLS